MQRARLQLVLRRRRSEPEVSWMLLLTLSFRRLPDLRPYDLLQTKFSADRLFLQRLPSQRLARREQPSQVSQS